MRTLSQRINPHSVIHWKMMNKMMYKFNREFFNVIDTEEKAYWLGFLAADGCIRKNKKNSHQLVLKLSVRDMGHVEKFKKSLKSNHKTFIHESIVNTKKGTISKSVCCVVRISGTDLYNDLVDKGVGPRKTFTLGRPNIPEEYYRHYIRGLFDGDGHCGITERKNGRLLIRYCIATVSPNMIDFLMGVLGKNNIFPKLRQINLRIENTDENIRFYHYLYDGATIYLDRKKETGDRFMNYHMDVMEWEKKYNTKKIVGKVRNDKDVDKIIKLYNQGFKPNVINKHLPHLKIRQIYRRIEELKKHKIITNRVINTEV